jgi:glycosyltransferase involved in cell wall biosynthesis
MRILFIRSIGKNKYGGGERWVINAATSLHNNGHFVTIAGLKDSILLDEASKNGLETTHLNIFTDFNVFQAYKLSRYILKNNFDIVVCKGRELIVTGLACKWANNTPLIRRTGLPPKNSKSKKLVWRTRLFVDGVITNTQTIQQIYRNNGFTDKDFVKVVYNGLVTHDSLPAFDFASLYPGKKIILCVGRVVTDKGYNFIIDALPLIKQVDPDIMVYALGEGKEMNRLKKYAHEKNVEDMIHFAGYVHQPVPYIKGCDLFLHASLIEGMPNAAMEAMAYAKPVIMTRVNGADELTDNGKYALLIPPADPVAIANAVNSMIHNLDSMKMATVDAQNYVRDKFGIQNMVSSLERYLLDRVEKKKNLT